MWSAAQQTTDRSSCLCGGKKKKRGGANSVFQTERSSWNPSRSLIAGAHIARKRFINQMRRLITFHRKQAKDAFVS